MGHLLTGETDNSSGELRSSVVGYVDYVKSFPINIIETGKDRTAVYFSFLFAYTKARPLRPEPGWKRLSASVQLKQGQWAGEATEIGQLIDITLILFNAFKV